MSQCAGVATAAECPVDDHRAGTWIEPADDFVQHHGHVHRGRIAHQRSLGAGTVSRRRPVRIDGCRRRLARLDVLMQPAGAGPRPGVSTDGLSMDKCCQRGMLRKCSRREVEWEGTPDLRHLLVPVRGWMPGVNSSAMATNGSTFRSREASISPVLVRAGPDRPGGEDVGRWPVTDVPVLTHGERTDERAYLLLLVLGRGSTERPAGCLSRANSSRAAERGLGDLVVTCSLFRQVGFPPV